MTTNDFGYLFVGRAVGRADSLEFETNVPPLIDLYGGFLYCFERGRHLRGLDCAAALKPRYVCGDCPVKGNGGNLSTEPKANGRARNADRHRHIFLGGPESLQFLLQRIAIYCRIGHNV